ncbi:MAG: nascent polypeptide-associated complex protein [Thermoproteota archaeon]
MKRIGSRESRRMQEQMMRRMGMKMEEVPGAIEVTIRTSEKIIKISNPSVVKYELQDQTFFQVTGTPEEETATQLEKPPVQLPEEDILLVAQQAGVSQEEARKALEATGGDLAQAIMLLKKA